MAQILGVDAAEVSRWRTRTEPLSDDMWWRIVNVHDVLTRLLLVLDREAAELWLVGSEPLLGGARPIDVLVLEGAAPVIRSIDGIAQGAHA
jgi:uncharacterized protein (DUF2384 family)